MRVLITGGAGQFGQAFSGYVGATGPGLTLFDIVGGRGVHQGDVNDLSSVRKAVAGHDAVVHAAALHGVHLKDFSEQEFLRVNVQGTETVLHACADAGIGHVVLISSTSVYGLSGSASFDRTVQVDEATPCKPNDANDLCKVLSEELAEYASRKYGIAVTVLRPGRFFVDDPVNFNLAKLSGAVDVEDVAQAVICALDTGGNGYQVFCISSGTRFGEDDLHGLSTRAHEVIEERYPGAMAAAATFGRAATRVHRVIDISKAQEQLGYQPARSFDDFVRRTLDTTSVGVGF